MATCGQLNLFETALVTANPALGPIIRLLNPPDWSKINSSVLSRQDGLLP